MVSQTNMSLQSIDTPPLFIIVDIIVCDPSASNKQNILNVSYTDQSNVTIGYNIQ